MADMTGWPTDGAEGSVSSEARWRAMARLFAPSGVVVGYLGELAPSLAGGTITVQAGAAWIDGHYAEIPGSSTFGSTVTGLVVARFTPADNRFELLYRDGATTPTQGTATWELPIARVTSSALYDIRPMVAPGGADNRRVGHVLLTAAAPAIDFESIPQTYQHLRLVAFLRGTQAAAGVLGYLQLNGDTGATYQSQRVRGDGSTATATFTPAANGIAFNMPGASATSSNFGPLIVDFPGYRSTGRSAVLYQNGWSIITGTGAPASGDLRVDSGFGYRHGTAAVNRVTLTPSAGNFAVGSSATLYGLA